MRREEEVADKAIRPPADHATLERERLASELEAADRSRARAPRPQPIKTKARRP